MSNTIITEEDVRKVAHLARLKLDEAAVKRHANNLTHILEMIAHIDELDTSDVVPMSSSLDIGLTLREDAIHTVDERTLLQKLAPKTESGFYIVPQVIE
jgi:aspartyl-tRNA(Asn)/glutamyl-tRNA(Gln) amidotransferase subunit C